MRIDDQIGLERTPAEYVAKIVDVMREAWRVLKDDGTLWINLGDSYATQPYADSHSFDPKYGGRNRSSGYPNRQKVTGLKHKDLVGIPWRVAFALQDDGWYLRSDIIWSKSNPMPESVTDRPTKAHEYIFLLTKQARYYYDAEAIMEPAKVWEGQAGVFERTGPVSEHVLPGQAAAQHRSNRNGKNAFRGQGAHRENETGKAHREGRDVTETGAGPMRNKRSVWTVATRPYGGAHFATFPPALVEPMILAGSRRGDVVLDMFAGSGTVGQVAVKHGRRCVMFDLNTKYIDLQFERLNGVQMVMGE